MKNTFFKPFLIATLLITIFATCSINKDVSFVVLNRYILTLAMGETETLTATVLPENAGNKSVTWSSDREEYSLMQINFEP